MPDVDYSPEQLDAIAIIFDWWSNRNAPQVLAIGGYAGVGKSTVIAAALELIGVDMQRVAYATYTGKAALVLRLKGCPAETLHKLCYEPLLASYVDQRTGIKKTKIGGFRPRVVLEKPVDLVVVDEVSMVSKDLLAILRTLCKRIIVLGDPAQLPPVRGAANGYLDRPDVFLKQIHRQAADNPILWAATRARNGQNIPYGVHGSCLRVIRRSELKLDECLAVDQVLCCTNATRNGMNLRMRAALGKSGLPKRGEKLVCRKNRWEEVSQGIPLINGLLCRVLKDVHELDVSRSLRTIMLNVGAVDVPGAVYWGLDSNLDFFEALDGGEPDTDDSKICHFDWGGTISVHRSQGSEFKRGVFIADLFGDRTTQNQLMYTGITRFSEEMTLAI